MKVFDVMELPDLSDIQRIPLPWRWHVFLEGKKKAFDLHGKDYSHCLQFTTKYAHFSEISTFTAKTIATANTTQLSPHTYSKVAWKSGFTDEESSCGSVHKRAKTKPRVACWHWGTGFMLQSEMISWPMSYFHTLLKSQCWMTTWL